MTPQEKAKWMADFWAQIAAGKTAQRYCVDRQWRDHELTKDIVPNMQSDLSLWRIKPEPRRKWEAGCHETYDAEVASSWRQRGWVVQEWVEVIKSTKE
jgi:hypothetical protein